MSHGSNQEESITTKPRRRIARIVVDRDLCIGAASCIAVAPGTFELDSEAKAIVKEIDAHDEATLIAAAESCPTLAIFIYDEDGKQIYPPSPASP